MRRVPFSTRVPAAAISAATLLLAPALARAQEEQPRPRPSGASTQIVSGALLLGIPYVASNVVGLAYSVQRNVFCSLDGDVELRALAGASTASCPNRGYGWLTVPLAGPFLALGGYRQDALPAVLLVADGALQLAGATLLVVGVVRNTRARDRSATVHVVPTAASSTVGLSVTITGM